MTGSSSHHHYSDDGNPSRCNEDGKCGKGSVVRSRLALVDKRRPLGSGRRVGRRGLWPSPDRVWVEQGDDRCLGPFSGAAGASDSRSREGNQQASDRKGCTKETQAEKYEPGPPKSTRPVHARSPFTRSDSRQRTAYRSRACTGPTVVICRTRLQIVKACPECLLPSGAGTRPDETRRP
jgi:hypothetical protein